MRYLVAFILLCPALASSSAAQVVEAAVCDILANPASFDGKTVRVKGTVVAGFEEFAIKSTGCNLDNNAIWLAYPEGTKAKAGPVGFLQLQLAKNNPAAIANASRPPVRIEKNKDFKQFDSLLTTAYKSGGMCLGCVRFTVTATLVGRLDGAKSVGVSRDSTGKFVAVNGFGNLNLYAARLVLQSVSDVSSQEIDYSGDATAASDSQKDSAGGDPFDAAHQIANAFGPGSRAAEQVEKAAAAYGKEGENNGVEVGFGASNEIPKSDGPGSDKNSPDGLVLSCTFDMERLKGESLTRAITHIGSHIVDIRTPTPGREKSFFDLEHDAWEITVLSAVGSRQKTLRLPGGYLVWNSAWPDGDRTKLVGDGISKFLTSWVSLASH